MAALGISYDQEASPGTETDPLVAENTFKFLDGIPVYPLVLAVREDIVSSIDTTCTYEQLKSPQTHQFLVRPALERMKAHKSYAIVYALLANAGQFYKEAEERAAFSGLSATRASLCELLATKMLKEYSPRELIDVLTFGFWPLRGDTSGCVNYSAARAERMSAIELAIRAESKKFLSSPLVVQILENIWSGKIVFYSSTDKGYDAISLHHTRKTAALYNTKEASVFKLSRLRVPRYRHFMQTASFAVLLGLYLMVLIERSQSLTTLELVMSFWALGYMLDEVVGFFSAGTTLFILNLWNLCDMGILALFVSFLGLRLYGFIFGDPTQSIADTAYDLLAANAIFLFPRLFAALDHTRYFSQMIISFRRMAIDLLASLLFIVVFFTGFFVAFSITFARGIYSTQTVAFNFLQIFFGFQLPAWQTIHSYNLTGKCLLVLFVGMAHFLVVTILVSVLSNTFSAVSKNAREEHQYLFAINTISCVKSDAFFFYQPPLNLIEWALHPLCYFLPHRRFIKLNRYVIKATHIPFLLAIYTFERFYLRPKSISGHIPLQRISSFETLANNFNGNTVKATLDPRKLRGGFRRESIATQAAQHVLDEVFRSSIRGPRNVGGGMYYGAVRSSTIKPRTADWIKEIPTPQLYARSTMGTGQLIPPNISISVPVEESDVRNGGTSLEKRGVRRRRLSLASTVMESEEESSETVRRDFDRGRVAGEADDGDDEYDEANAVLEDEDVTDHEAKPRALRMYSLQNDLSGRHPARRPSPTRRHSSKPGKSGYKSRKGRPRSPASEEENKRRKMLSDQKPLDPDVESREQGRGKESMTIGNDVDRTALLEQLRTLETLMVGIRNKLEQT